MMNSKSTFNFRLRPTKRDEGLCGLYHIVVGVKVGARSFLEFVMLAAFHNYKVIRGVVGAIAVNVMHNLITCRWSTQHLLGNYAMLIKQIRSHFAYYSIPSMGNMTTFPVPMSRTKSAARADIFSTTYGRFAKLLQACRGKGLISKSPVFLGGHLVDGPKMGSGNLHAANQSTKLASDSVFHVIAPSGNIIPQGCNNYNVGV